MHIKRFEAATMEAALAQVKADLGPDALILSSRTIRRGRLAFGLLAKERVEIQAAIERGSHASRDRPGSTGVEPSPAPLDGSHGTHVLGRRDEPSMMRQELARFRAREQFEDEVRSELRGLRVAIQGVMGQAMRETADSVVTSLSRSGLDWEHAQGLVEEWRDPGGNAEEESLEAVLVRRIERKLAVPRVVEQSAVRVLVGAPGVGKTTTLAKLAARNEEGEREVALVSLDHYRIGATDQLRHYAELLQSPFSEVAELSALQNEVERFGGYSVLVDTAGRGRSSVNELEPIGSLREALQCPVSIELVIDATARREVQQAQLARFASLQPDRIIFCKTDECDSLASVTNLLLDKNCPPLCWMGNGQRVPEDLELVEAPSLAREVIGDRL